MIEIVELKLSAPPQVGVPLRIDIEARQSARILFEIDLILEYLDRDGMRRWLRLAHQDQASAAWLPAGAYRWQLLLPEGGFPAVDGTLRASLQYRDGPDPTRSPACSIELRDTPVGRGLESSRLVLGGDPDPATLSWQRGHGDWFFRHFDHAASTVGGYLLKDSPLLRGRILDVGCGDGITDLGLYLRYRPERLVGIDPFEGYARLAEVAAREHLPLEPWPPGLEFRNADANHLPFADDSFDVVVSWGSLEHIAGGYLQALREIKRVLRPDGLAFLHPGLFYSNAGHHLGEFSSEPFFHLKQSRESLRDFVLSHEPVRMDRAGHVASSAEYWLWYTELNPITVGRFEAELRALEFEPWRVALRTEPLIEYSPEILHYPMQDLATAELYLSCWNRKRSAG